MPNKVYKKFGDHVSKHVFHMHGYHPMLKFLIKKYANQKELTGCEVGVFYAHNADCTLHHLPISHLYLIDPYIEYDDFFFYKDGNKKIHVTADEVFEIAKRRLKDFEGKAIFIRKFSYDAINDIKEQLDFCYLDADHRYEQTKRDIEIYYPLIKSGGVIGGHAFQPGYQGVVRAVIEFAEEHGENFSGVNGDWWIVKEG